jgi:hypothetical protein
MPIVISRTGELNMQAPSITQDQRDALWAAFVTNWLDQNQQQFSEMLTEPEKASA